MLDDISGTWLAGYGAETYECYHYTCVYCGFDGRGFDAWMQLTVDHLRRRNSGGTDEPDNLVAACNSVTSMMTFLPTDKREDILSQKRTRVRERRAVFYEHWLKIVAPRFLDHPLPGV